MPATAQPNASAGYVDFDEYVDFQIEKTRQSIKWTDIITAAAGVAAFVVGYLLLFAIFDHWVIPGGFGRTARFLMVGGLLLVTGGWLTWKVVLPYLKQVSGLYAARTIESSAPGLKSTLLNLVDLRRAGRDIPDEIRNTLEKRAAQALSKMDVDQAVDRKPLMRTAYVLLGLVVFACLYSVFSPKKLSVVRALLPPANVAAATRTVILDVRTDPQLTRTAQREVDVVARSQLAVIVDLSGEVPEDVTLRYTTADRKFVDEPIALELVEEGLKQFRGVLNGENGRGILQSMTFHVVAGDAVSDEYRVLVNQAPAATVDEVRYIYPDYMELESKLQTGGNIDAWEGTKVSIAATVNQPVKSAILQFFDDEEAQTKAEEMRMEISANNRLRAAWTLKFRPDGTFPRSYRIFCVTDEGQSDPEPTLYLQTIRPDRRPVVEILEPRGDLEVPANAIIPLLIEARDPDFKLRYVTLRRQKNGEVLPRSPEIFKGLQQDFRGEWDFDLKPMNLKPGDVVTYWAEARDNKQPLGNLSEKRQLLELHIVDRLPQEEIDKQLDEDRARIKQRIEEADRDDNQEGQPEQQQQEDGSGGDEPQNGGDEPQPGEGKPQDSEDGNAEDKNEGSNDKQPGKAGSKPGDDENGQPGEDGKPQAGEPEGQQQKNERPLDTEGDDDSEALRRLLEKARKEQQEKKENGDVEEKPGDKNQDDKQPGDETDQPEGKQPGDKGADESPDGKSPMNDVPGDEGDGTKKPGDGNQPNEGSKPDAGEKPDKGKQPDGAGKNGGDNSKDGGSDQGDTQGKSTDGEKSKNDKPGNGGGDKPSQDAKDPKSSDETTGGNEKPAEPSDDAQRKKATGNEKGPATADNDPNADPTQAKNKLERKNGEKPTTRPSKEKPTGDAQKKPGDGMGNKKPGAAKPAPDTKTGNKNKPSENPDKRPSDSKEGDPNSPAAKQDEQQDKGNDELKGKGRPDGQSSEKPDGGEEGSGKPSDEGKKGGNKPGAGDSSKKPGMEEQGDPSKPGEPGDQRGDGSQKTDGNKKEGSGKPGSESGQPGDSSDSGEPGDPADSKPGDTPGGASKPGNDPKGGDGTTRGGANQGPTGNTGSDNGAISEAEKANLEYNKKATDLVLKRLQEQLENDEVDQKLLDEFGWTKDDMRRYLDRMKRTIDKPVAKKSPETESQRRQIEEFLKGYQLRQGRSERDQTSEGVEPLRSKPAPAEFKDAFEAYTRSLSRRASRRNRQKTP